LVEYQSVSLDSGDDVSIVSDVLNVSCPRLKLIHHNVQGLWSKWDDIQEWMAGSGSAGSIFCFSETWIKPKSLLLQMPGFHAFYSPFLLCPGSQKYLPGSCMFVSDTLKPNIHQYVGRLRSLLYP